MDLTYQYTKARGNFGRQPLFCEYGPEMCDNIPVQSEEWKYFILRNPVHEAVQNTPNFSERYINTIRAEYTSTSMNHAEGGWPKDVNMLDPEATQRYRRKVEKDDGYINCVQLAAPIMDKLVMQNNAIDMYQTYFTELPPITKIETTSCRTVNVYRDRDNQENALSRGVSSICWRPDGGPKFAVTYVDINFERMPRGPIHCNIWDTENANNPETSITPPSVLMDLQYNPRNMSTLAGGMLNGQVAVWDLRESTKKPSVECPPHVAHRDMARFVRFINAKNGMEFFSSGPDGACKWWDIRKIDEPIDEMIIDLVPNANVKQSMANTFGVSRLEFEPTIPTRFMVATENGYVIGGNRKGKSPIDQLPSQYQAHDGPVMALERNPGFLKMFLTVGDWTMRVWSEDCKESAVLWSPPQRYKLNHGAWSPTRFPLMLLAQSNGSLALWDLLRRQHEPILTLNLCKEPLVLVQPHDAGSLAACASSVGNIYLVELSKNLVESDANEKGLLSAIFERESKRERILEARLREIRVRARQAEEGGSPGGSAHEMDVGDRDLQEAATEYFSAVKKELAAL